MAKATDARKRDDPSAARQFDSTHAGTVTGTDSDGVSRQDAYNCTTNLEQSQGSSNESCHVQVEDCVAVVDCYRVASGNPIPFDTWAIDHCP